MQNFSIVGALAFFTIGAVLVFAIVSWMRAKKAQNHHEDAAVAQRHRAEDGEASAVPDTGRSWSKERGANPPTAPVTPPD